MGKGMVAESSFKWKILINSKFEAHFRNHTAVSEMIIEV